VSDRRIRRIVIVGGGIHGWMAATALATALRGGCQLEVVDSGGTTASRGAESTTVALRQFNAAIGLAEDELVAAAAGTFKLGSQFIDWGKVGHRYFHPYGQFGADFDSVPLHQYWLRARTQGDASRLDDYSLAWGAAGLCKFDRPTAEAGPIQSTYDYAYHLDTVRYTRRLRALAEERGVLCTEGRVAHASLRATDGFIESLELEDGRSVAGDFFINCSADQPRVLEDALQTRFEDWAAWLPCDRMIEVPCASGGEFTPYTRATARAAGWQWRMPLQDRLANGYAFSSAFQSDEAAATCLLSQLDGKALGEPQLRRLRLGRAQAPWSRNCLALGEAAVCLDPLEGAGLQLMHSGIARFLALFPERDVDPLLPEEYNRLALREHEQVRDFQLLHYHATSRDDSEFWRHCATMPVTDALAYRMRHFRAYGRLIGDATDVFTRASWLAVCIGQQVWPRRYDPLVDERSSVDAARLLGGVRRTIGEIANAMPTHRQYIEKHCRART
jgi:tryptophan 7-halogenase